MPLYLLKTPDVFTTQLTAYVHEALAEGLAGWQVTDCRVTVTDCGYASPATSAADYRRLTELVMATALDRAGTWVCEPLADLALEMPTSTAPASWGRSGASAAASRGSSRPTASRRRAPCWPWRASGRSSTSCPACRWGRGSSSRVSTATSRSASDPPRRTRSTPSPLDRDAWLASLTKRG